MSFGIYIRVPHKDDLVRVCSKVYPGMSKLVVTGLISLRNT